MLRKFAEFIMLNTHNACACALLFTLLGPCWWISAIIVALVTLRHGMRQGVWVLLFASVPHGIIVWQQANYLLLLNHVVPFMLVYAVAAFLRYSRSWVMSLQLFVILGAVAIVLLHVLVPDIVDWWRQQLTVIYAYLNEQLHLQTLFDKDVLINTMAMISSGVVASRLLLNAFLQLLLARYCQALLYYPGGLRTELNQLRLSPAMAGILLATLLAALAGVAIAVDLLPVLLLPFVLVGVFFVHALAHKHQKKVILLMVFYVMLVLFMQFMLVFLVLIALLDSCVNFRQRLKQRIINQ